GPDGGGYTCFYGRAGGRTSADARVNASRSWSRSIVMYPRLVRMEECPRISVMVVSSTPAAFNRVAVVLRHSCNRYRLPVGCRTPARSVRAYQAARSILSVWGFPSGRGHTSP